MTGLVEIASRLVAADTVSVRGNAGVMGELGDRLDAAGFRVALQRWGEGDGPRQRAPQAREVAPTAAGRPSRRRR